ncbi:Small heat shock protein C4 [Halomicronema hongdechloris C2206]|uniref:Small heat shock protein C4 n=1 Tax=Halomicronema hongdechloris C2206 TaxID=1641165 RepID=A0A1Z3HSU1_9CYAN|nr:Hsp20/alpha crystallin family protein [Halomicronema hongdechloris]ASC73368.1 Small heat shock protein C4 [Halomicronema hongdechloris C2206]
MALVRWEPFRELDNLQKEMNRLFDSFSPERYGRLTDGVFAPAAEINETDDAVDLKLELPGMKPEDVDVQVAADAVVISGERKSESRTDEDGYVRSEFHYGKFQRTIPLPTRVQNADASAEYKDGILTLHLPKAEEERNKVVKVQLNPASS